MSGKQRERKVKCPECGMLNHKDVAVFHKKRYYCKICHERVLKESQDYKDLVEYICELYKVDVPNGWMFKQIKEFKEKYNYSYRGMKSTLHYFYEIMKNDPEDALGIGIIPFVYEEAKQYYIDKKKVADSTRILSKEDMNKKQTITISKADKKDSEKFKQLSIIDIDDLT